MAVELYYQSQSDSDKVTRQKIERLAEKLGTGTMKVGFLANRTYPNGISVAQVAFWNEFGTKRAPARPFFRTTIAAKQKTWADKLGQAMIYYKSDSRKALAALGQDVADDITVAIQRWSTPANAAATIKRKGFNKPLVHTRVMVDAPDYVVT